MHGCYSANRNPAVGPPLALKLGAPGMLSEDKEVIGDERFLGSPRQFLRDTRLGGGSQPGSVFRVEGKRSGRKAHVELHKVLSLFAYGYGWHRAHVQYLQQHWTPAWMRNAPEIAHGWALWVHPALGTGHYLCPLNLFIMTCKQIERYEHFLE